MPPSTRRFYLPLFPWQRYLGIVYVMMVFITYMTALLSVRYSHLIQMQLLPTPLAALQVTVEIILVVVTSLLSGLLLWRRGDERIAVLIAVSIMTLPGILPFPGFLASAVPIFHIPMWIMTTFGATLNFWGFISLPDGSIIYRRLRWLAPLMMIWDTIRYPLFFINPSPEFFRLRPATLLVNLIFWVIALLSLVRRYRSHSTPLQRQQFKWYFLGLYILGLEVLLVLPLRIVSQALFGQSDATLVGGLISSVLSAGGILFYEAMIVVSITRYGLWDVDLTLNRSVVIGLVSFVVLGLFGLGFGLMQAVLRLVLPGDQSQGAAVVAALAAGAAFNPIRHRVRRLVDRRVYGLRFDLDQLDRLHKALPLYDRGLHTGRMVEGYKLLEVIGRGGMGEVYKAQSAAGDSVAIKLLREVEAQDHTSKQRLTREGMVQITHPHIVQVESYGEIEGMLYVVMEYVAGPTLKEVLQKQGRIPLDEVLPILSDLADAIDAVHAEGYIHRDIKPSNVILSMQQGRPRVVLMDFGLAKLIHNTTSLTGSGAVGTIDYMAPEQIREARKVDYRADLYAFGIVAYELLTGHPPFSGTAGHVLFSHLNQPPPPLRGVLPDVPPALELSLEQMLSKDPDLRFQSAHAFVESVRVPQLESSTKFTSTEVL